MTRRATKPGWQHGPSPSRRNSRCRSSARASCQPIIRPRLGPATLKNGRSKPCRDRLTAPSGTPAGESCSVRNRPIPCGARPANCVRSHCERLSRAGCRLRSSSTAASTAWEFRASHDRFGSKIRASSTRKGRARGPTTSPNAKGVTKRSSPTSFGQPYRSAICTFTTRQAAALCETRVREATIGVTRSMRCRASRIYRAMKSITAISTTASAVGSTS